MTDRERQFVDDILARSAGCPAAERLEAYDANALDAEARKRVEDHVSACEACGAALKFLASEPEGQTTPEEVLRRSEAWIAETSVGEAVPKARFPRWTWVVAAAAVIFVVLLFLPPGERTGSPEMRTPGRTTVESLVPDGPLPREACRLQWTPGPEGSTYRLTVFTEGLRTLATWENLGIPEHVVPAEVLLPLEGDTFVWRVEVFPPDGAARVSATFTAELDK